MATFRSSLLVAFLTCLGPLTAASQEPAAPAGRLRVYLDCQNTGCDFNYLREEIGWVDWVRDRADADVHALVTGQPSGGGRETTIHLIGLRGFQSRDDETRFNTSTTATSDEYRRELSRTLQLSLVGYAMRSDLGRRLTVRYDSGGRVAMPVASFDRWDHWVFRLGASGFVWGESRSESSNLNGSMSARRITDNWKLRVAGSYDYSTSSFEFDDGSTYESILRGASGSVLVARTLGSRWTAGFTSAVRRSDQENLDRSIQVLPGIEFSLFPYRQASRRLITALYEIGVASYTYADTTIYDLTEETRGLHRLTLGVESQQPWGSSDVAFQASAYLDDWEKRRLALSGGVNVRVVKGLEVRIGGSYAQIRDQLFLPKEGATDEEVLLRLRQLKTSYRYSGSVGLSYTFGSIFNNIVNRRFENAGGQGGGGHF
jgi:hypothetical protein